MEIGERRRLKASGAVAEVVEMANGGVRVKVNGQYSDVMTEADLLRDSEPAGSDIPKWW